MTIKELELLESKKRKSLIDTQNRLKELRMKSELPNLKKQHEDKYYKYSNSYSLSDRWDIYIYVVEINKNFHAILNTFETTAHGISEFKIKEESSLRFLENEISKEEYENAFFDFRTRLWKLIMP